jgi:hypothetical protein
MEANAEYLTISFRDLSSAERAYDRLHQRGYSDNVINILMSDDAREKYFGEAPGATSGIITSIGTSLRIPGLGVIILGPIAAGFEDAAARGGVAGALIGAGIPDEDARKYEEKLKEGDIVMAVRPHSNEDVNELEKDLQEFDILSIFANKLFSYH